MSLKSLKTTISVIILGDLFEVSSAKWAKSKPFGRAGAGGLWNNDASRDKCQNTEFGDSAR